MLRVASLFILLLAGVVPLAAQTPQDSAQVPTIAATVVPAPTPEPLDTAIAGKPLVERMVSGAVVGAATGAALSAQDMDCAPSEAGAAAFVGGVWGAIRAAFGWNPADEMHDPTETKGVDGPFPFDGEKCSPEDGS